MIKEKVVDREDLYCEKCGFKMEYNEVHVCSNSVPSPTMKIMTIIVKCPEKICELTFPADDIGQKYEECPNCLFKIKIR